MTERYPGAIFVSDHVDPVAFQEYISPVNEEVSIKDPVSEYVTTIGNVPIGARVPEAIEFERIFGGVVSVGIVFAKTIYCISERLSEKSQVFDPVLYVPV